MFDLIHNKFINDRRFDFDFSCHVDSNSCWFREQKLIDIKRYLKKHIVVKFCFIERNFVENRFVETFDIKKIIEINYSKFIVMRKLKFDKLFDIENILKLKTFCSISTRFEIDTRIISRKNNSTKWSKFNRCFLSCLKNSSFWDE